VEGQVKEHLSYLANKDALLVALDPLLGRSGRGVPLGVMLLKPVLLEPVTWNAVSLR
jgi:hypothetical protein